MRNFVKRQESSVKEVIAVSMNMHPSNEHRMPVIVPTRYHTYTSNGHRFSLAATADFFADSGFDGMDLSLDTIEELGTSLPDDAWRAALYALGNRAAAKGLAIPVCHLPFAMPCPDDDRAMTRFAKALSQGLDAAAFLNIPVAVIHPIVRHSSRASHEAWLNQNIAFLSLLRKKANRLSVALAVENMAGIPYPAHPSETVFGSRAEDIRALADRLDVGICWDTGHARLSGLHQSTELAVVGNRLRMLHLHDNDGRTDSHLPPFAGSVDWEDVARGLRSTGFPSMPWRCLNLEIKASHLPADRAPRDIHAAQALQTARRLMQIL